MKRILLVFLLALALAIWGMGRAEATIYTLSDLNSTVSISSATQAGMFNWTVDGTNHMYQQWFWYRLGNTGGQSSFDTLAVVGVVASSSLLQLTYAGSGFNATVTYSLLGGTAGSHSSDVGEQIRFINTSGSTLPLHFFQYTDFDLNGTISDDTGVRTNANTIQQFDPFTVMSETVATPSANHWEISLYPTLLNHLNSGSPYTLADGISPRSGDVTWGFEWDANIAPNGTFNISKDKNLRPVPEPATMLLLGSGLLGMGVFARRRFKK